MRKVVVGLIVIILIFLGILLVPRFANVNYYRPQIEARLRDRLGRDVSLGQMTFSFFPLGFRAENVVISELPEFRTGKPFAEIQTFYVRPELWPLLHKEIRIKSLQLQGAKVELVRSNQGVWNFADMQGNTSQNKSYSLDQMKLYDGQIAVTDMQQHRPRAVYDHIDLIVNDFALDKSFSIDAHAHMPGAGKETIALAGKVGPLQKDVVSIPFQGNLKLNQVSLAELRQFAKIEALVDSNAMLTGDADLKTDAGVIVSKGSINASDVQLRGVNLGYPINADYDLSASLNDGSTEIRKANLKLGKTPISVEGSVKTQPSSVIDLKVQSSNAPISDVARLAAAFGTAFHTAMDVSGQMNINVHAQGPLNKPTLDGQVAAHNLRVSGGDLREPVQVDNIDVALSPDTIRSNDFTAKTGRTSVTGQFTLSQYTSNAPQLQARMNTGNAELGELLRIARAYRIDSVEGLTGSGSITMDVTATGPLNKTDQLTFSGNGAMRNVSISSASMAKALEIRTADLRFNANGVAFDNLDFSLGQTTARGNLTARNFNAPNLQFSFAANHVNVAEWEQILQSESKKGTEPKPAPAQRPNPSQSIFTRMTGSGTVTVQTVVYDQLTLNDVHSTVNLDNGIITLKPITAGLYNGHQVGTVVMNARTRPVTYTVDSSLEGVDANQLLSSISPAKQTIYGVLSAKADTHFTTSSGAAGIAQSLNGKASIKLNDGKIGNLDLLHQLATIGQFQTTARAVEPFTKLVQMAGDFDIHNGVATTHNLRATIEDGSLAANGTVDLAHQNLNLHVTAVLSPQFSQAVGGTSIGGLMNTALANRNGELVIPVVVTGTFQNPQVAPDLQQVAQMKLRNLLPSVNDPTKFTDQILGQVLRGKPGQQVEPQAQPGVQNPEEQLRDILGNVLGKKKAK
jgi:AsmA protein